MIAYLAFVAGMSDPETDPPVILVPQMGVDTAQPVVTRMATPLFDANFLSCQVDLVIDDDDVFGCKFVEADRITNRSTGFCLLYTSPSPRDRG